MSDTSPANPTSEELARGFELVREEIARRGGAIAFAAKLADGVLEMSGLDPTTYTLVRIAALAATGAPPMAWDLNLEIAEEMGISAEDILGVLVAVTPVIGTARFMDAVSQILED